MWGLLKHMYTNGDYPFKFGRLVGEVSSVCEMERSETIEAEIG